MPTVSFRLPKEAYEALRRRAEEEGMTISDFMRYIVEKCAGIEVNTKSDIERRIEELERRITELERLVRQQRGLEWYTRRRKS